MGRERSPAEVAFTQCSRCLFGEDSKFYLTHAIIGTHRRRRFAIDEEGVCTLCREYETGYSRRRLDEELDELVRASQSGVCAVLGISGGKDSLATLYSARVRLGLSVVGVLLDNGFIPRPVLHADRLFMAHGIETRMPFLDSRLVRAALSIPVAELVDAREDKPLLRGMARRRLGDSCVMPKKKGLTGRAYPPIDAQIELAERMLHAGLMAIDGDALSRMLAWARTDALCHSTILWRVYLLETVFRLMAEGLSRPPVTTETQRRIRSVASDLRTRVER